MSSPATQIQFNDSQVPSVRDGSYDLTIKHQFEISDTTYEENTVTGTGGQLTFTTQQSFLVKGPALSINPTQIHGVFPPANGLGVYGNVLPHLMLSSLTLPWQRLPDPKQPDQNAPWLALLVFSASNCPKLQIVKASTLTTATTTSPYWPGISSDETGSGDTNVQVIDVPTSTLQNLLPKEEELPFLAHTRASLDSKGNSQSSFSTLVANTIPEAAGKTTIHLVNLEGRYSNGNFDVQGAQPSDLIRLVSMYHWSFSSTTETHNFKAMVSALNVSPSAMQLPIPQGSPAEPFLNQGQVPLKHSFRTGDHSVSWYRGPLKPLNVTEQANEDVPDLSQITCSDALLEFYNDLGMLQTSYAAAWELGRLLMLSNQRVSTALYTWKHQIAQNQIATPGHLLKSGNSQKAMLPELPTVVVAFFQSLATLSNVPFDYLVPKEDMLPAESMRFFQIDKYWVECLMYGAYQVGRVPKAPTALPFDVSQIAVSGLIMRSAVVADFPHLQINGFNATQVKANPAAVVQDSLTLLRMEQLSPNVLIALFDDHLAAVDIHQKPEVLHFGFDGLPDGELQELTKALKNTSGPTDLNSIPFIKSTRTVEISKLTQSIEAKLNPPGASPIAHSSVPTLHSAQFAYQMIEGVENVRFSFLQD